MASVRMPFGKYKGRAMEDIPSDYLHWLAENMDIDRIATAADEEYNYRDLTNGHFWEDGGYGEEEKAE